MIKRIRIRDFKSVGDVELEFDPVTVLVGRSGTGKSNLVQAIRFLRNYLLNPDAAVAYEFGWERILPAGKAQPKPSIEVTFSVPAEDEDYTYIISFGRLQHRGDVPRLMAERLRLGNHELFSRSRETGLEWVWDREPEVTSLPHHADTPMLGSFPSLQKIVFAYAALSTGIGYYHFPASTLTTPRGPEHGQEFLQAIPGLADNAMNYRDIMRGITQDFHHPELRKGILASIKTVNPDIESIELDSLTQPQKAIIGHRSGGRVFSLSLEQESDGLRRFYAHLLALYQPMPKLTLVFEEPENAVFPGALSLLADEFKAAPHAHRGQVILTTHSPILLDSFDVENVRVVEMREGFTVVGKVSQEQRDAVRDRLMTTGELLTVDRARLEKTAPKAS